MVTDLPIIGYYDRQRFTQFNPADTANWYMVASDIGKKKVAMYPTMGRQHVSFLNQNRLNFGQTPRAIYKSINYWYSVVNDQIYRIDKFFNQIEITTGTKLTTINGNIFFTYLVAGDPAIAGNTTYACFTDGQNLYIYSETAGTFGIVTDANLPKNPIFIATFGNRLAVSGVGSSTFGLSVINLGGASVNLATCFTVNGNALFAQESGIIRQMGVLQNTLYIFTDFTTGLWSNIPSQFTSTGGTVSTFPWKKNTTIEWDFGMADPNSLDIDFGTMAWEAQNRNGIIQIMASIEGRKPQAISTKAIDVLLQRIANADSTNPFLNNQSDGFLYDYENTVFYRVSGGKYTGTQLLDQVSTANSIEYNFDTQTWHRCIEKNGERNRIQKHVFFNNMHLVTVQGDSTVYEMSGRYYTNEIRNPAQSSPIMSDSYIREPFRYLRTTPIICAGLIEGLKAPGFYAEFITDYIEIDMCFGDGFINSDAPFANAVYLIDEASDDDGNPIFLIDESDPNEQTFLIAEGSNTPVAESPTYRNWYKPHIELYFSNDGGVSFLPADVREFSPLGNYQWRMRWYELGCSRNRVYKLVCVSPVPITLLGASQEVRNASGGAA